MHVWIDFRQNCFLCRTMQGMAASFLLFNDVEIVYISIFNPLTLKVTPLTGNPGKLSQIHWQDKKHSFAFPCENLINSKVLKGYSMLYSFIYFGVESADILVYVEYFKLNITKKKRLYNTLATCILTANPLLYVYQACCTCTSLCLHHVYHTRWRWHKAWRATTKGGRTCTCTGGGKTR